MRALDPEPLFPIHKLPLKAEAEADFWHPQVGSLDKSVWSMTAQLVTDALVMAIWRPGKPDAPLHHSDRGSQYTSEQLQRLMADHGFVCSMSRSGNVRDNAAMESFFSSLKIERTNTECTERGMTPRPTSSIILSASTIRSVGTRRSDI